jgi:uncharacterized phage protein gp47/JayE
MAGFGVTEEGFNLKGFDAILGESLERARQAFGANVDLTSTSPLRKILEATAAEDAELWKSMEDLYYSNFMATAVGSSLDLLGEELGLPRRLQFAQGEVTFRLANPTSGHRYVVPEGAVVVTASPARAFHTTAPLILSGGSPQGKASVVAFERGPDGNIPAHQIVGIEPVYQKVYFGDWGAATLAVSNDRAFAGGETTEPDEVYRNRLLGLPRALWTLDSVRRAALEVDGVLDVLLSDPLGGIDVSQSYFNQFNFAERVFGGDFSSGRLLVKPYFFDVIVAHESAWPWRSWGPVPGIYEQVKAALDRVRPIGIHPNIMPANHIDVGLHAKVISEPGYDPQTLKNAITRQLADAMGALKLGGDVLYSQVMRVFVEQPGVVDVRAIAFKLLTFASIK